MAKKRTSGTVMQPPETPLSGYIEHFIKFGAKKKGKALENEIDAVLEAAKEDLSKHEWNQLEETIAPDRREKRAKQRRPKGQGLTRAEWRVSKFKEAEVEGIWYPGHPTGCMLCGGTDRKHYSGGKCTKCYTIERNKRLIAEGKMVDPEIKKAEKEKAKAMKAAAEKEARAMQKAARLEAQLKEAKKAVK